METKRTIYKKLDKPFSNYVSSYESWVVIHNDNGGYVEGKIELHVKSDGISIWEGDDAVYLDYERLKWILGILKEEGML